MLMLIGSDCWRTFRFALCPEWRVDKLNIFLIQIDGVAIITLLSASQSLFGLYRGSEISIIDVLFMLLSDGDIPASIVAS